jgi:hypothetical protein
MTTFQVQLWTPDKFGNLSSSSYQRVAADDALAAAEKLYGAPLTPHGQNHQLRAMVRRLDDTRSNSTPFYAAS